MPQQLQEMLEDQRERWRNGQPKQLKDYCVSNPRLGQSGNSLLDLIYNEILLRKQLGEAPCLSEYVTQFPSLQLELELLFQVDIGLDNATYDANSSQPAIPYDSHPVNRIATTSVRLDSMSEPDNANQPEPDSDGSGRPVLRIQNAKGKPIPVSRLLRQRLLVATAVLAISYAQAYPQLRALFF
ncbi:MAG: hypothetical protein ABL921_30385, partial [Pirellula sp.]